MTPEFDNRTTIPTESLLPLVEWAREFTGGDAKRCGLLLIHRRSAHNKIDGRAYSHARIAGRRSAGFEPGLPFVRIQFSPGWEDAKYPMTEEYVKGIPITYQNWKEHFIVYLAHEFKHIRQYEDRRKWGALNTPGDRDPWPSTLGREADAEQFAIGAVEAFRKTKIYKQKLSNARVMEEKMCPMCKTYGDIATHFGFRKAKGKTIPQSYCYTCRRG